MFDPPHWREPFAGLSLSGDLAEFSQIVGHRELGYSVEVAMSPWVRVLSLLASLLASSCASQADQAPGGASPVGRITAHGYTREGCFLNLKLAAREQNVRLKPDDVTVHSNTFLLIFPFLNQEAYQCTGVVVERQKRTTPRDGLYPID